MLPRYGIIWVSPMDKIHKTLVMELDSVDVEAGVGGFEVGKLVCLVSGLAIHQIINTDLKAQQVLGIADESKDEGETGSIRITGTVTNPAWTWTPGDKIWASSSLAGELTAVQSGSHLFVGTAITATKIVLSLNSVAYIPTVATLITGSGTVDVPLTGEGYKVVPTGDIELNLLNAIAGRTYTFKIVQNGTLRLVTFSQPVIWNKAIPYEATTINSKDVVAIWYDGEDYLGTFGTDYGV